MTCSAKNYKSKTGVCCERCPAGKYVKEDCTGTQRTQCADCANDHYTATDNGANRCQKCDECSSDNNQMKFKNCTRTENTVCRCMDGFYCSSDKCDHCLPVKSCPAGQGVKTTATRTHDTVCAECEKGTYSNVTDYHSPCKSHIRCEDFGKMLETPGTQKADAVCGGFSHSCSAACSWALPAALWAGLVLTALILFAIVICRKAKRKSYRAGSVSVPATLVQVVPVQSLDLPLPVTSQDSPLCLTKLTDHCQESCSMKDFNIFEQDELDSSLPITPLKASVSFAEPSYVKNSGYCTSDYLMIQSEPQEDEWCGT